MSDSTQTATSFRSLGLWPSKRVKFVVSFITSGPRGWGQYYSDNGPVFLRIGNLRRDSIELDMASLQHVQPPPGAEGSRTRVLPEDVLVSITADIGSVAVVRKPLGEAYINQHIALLRPIPGQADSRWLAYALCSHAGRGIEWLGEIPAHWEVKRLKHLTRKIVDGAHLTPTYVDQGVPFLRVTDIHGRRIDWDNVKRIPEEEHRFLTRRCRPEKGDLLLSKNGTIGVPFIINFDIPFSFFVSLCLLKLASSLDVRFAHSVFLSHPIEEQITGGSKKNTVTNLHLNKISEFWFPVPPRDEQSLIVEHVRIKAERIDETATTAEIQIEKLREYRQALISAAVTGKIDVTKETI